MCITAWAHKSITKFSTAYDCPCIYKRASSTLNFHLILENTLLLLQTTYLTWYGSKSSCFEFCLNSAWQDPVLEKAEVPNMVHQMETTET